MAVMKKIRIEDFREKTTPHFNSILRLALRLTKNQTAAEALTTTVYLQAWQAFSFYKSEMDCRAWLLKILFRQFDRDRSNRSGSALVEDDENRMLKLADSLEVEANEKISV